MAKTIQQKIVFKNSTPEALYRCFLNPKQHALIIGGPVKISAKEGSAFSAYNGWCYGQNLQLIKNKLIVQSWRAADWSEEDVDSTLVLLFEMKGKDALLEMVHANVPDRHAAALSAGWKQFYWNPMKDLLALKK
jgi:activator of HSP90 ATPase